MPAKEMPDKTGASGIRSAIRRKQIENLVGRGDPSPRSGEAEAVCVNHLVPCRDKVARDPLAAPPA